MSSINQDRKIRSLIVYGASFVLFTSLVIFLVWSMRSLILPIIIGSLLAYVFKPLVKSIKFSWVPETLSVIIVLSLIILGVTTLTTQIYKNMPNEAEKIELLVKVKQQSNIKYESFMGLTEENRKGNFIYGIVGAEIEPVRNQINDLIDKATTDETVANAATTVTPVEAPKGIGADSKSSVTATLWNILSNWLVLPFIFIFLMFDSGQIMQFFVRLIPNRYFELSITVLEEVDEALGKYLRGTLLQCSLVALTLFVGLFLLGFNLKVALIIGILAGISNAIPFLGPVMGLAYSLCYALILEEINPILPFVTMDNLVVGVFIVVLIAQILDNTIFQPIVLGSAVNLHPLVVVLGVMGGSIIFGFSGMLLAIPAIVISKVVSETMFKELKAYRII